MDIQTYELPNNWACYLINGDESGYDEGEVDLIDQWMLRTFPFGVIAWAVDVKDNGAFMRYHDAHNVLPFAADCATYTFHLHPAL